MSPPPAVESWLQGKRIAFAGRLASMTRAEARALVSRLGGEYVEAVNRHTAVVVIGQESWPLRQDGALASRLQRARSLQRRGAAIEILPEEEWLTRLGLDPPTNAVHRRYTMAQLCQLLRVPRDRIRAWVRAELIQPAESVQGLWYFDFRQITGVKTLWDLAQAGVKVGQIRRSLEQLRKWFPDVEQPLAQLRLMDANGQVLIRLQEGQIVDPSGQQHFDFEAGAAAPVATPQPGPRGKPWRRRGQDLEEAGQFEAAVHAYRQALLEGPDAEVCFNLGNVLYRLRRMDQAAECYRQAAEVDADFAEAWNNLGNVLVELGQWQDALEAYHRALTVRPQYADAQYNLADALDQLRRTDEARRAWQAYVRLEPRGASATYAKQRLAVLGGRSG